MRTMSIARTTPAQKPRGFNNSNVLASDKSAPTLYRVQGTRFPWEGCFKGTENGNGGQRKRLTGRGLAADGELLRPNGDGGAHHAKSPNPTHVILIECFVGTQDRQLEGLSLRD